MELMHVGLHIGTVRAHRSGARTGQGYTVSTTATPVIPSEDSCCSDEFMKCVVIDDGRVSVPETVNTQSVKAGLRYCQR